ncbi:hypothetical protein ACU8KH_02576 [Lachancea thermotolerans]
MCSQSGATVLLNSLLLDKFLIKVHHQLLFNQFHVKHNGSNSKLHTSLMTIKAKAHDKGNGRR